MDADGPSGLRNAPVTKFLGSMVGIGSALAAVLELKPYMATELVHLTTHGQLWRLFTNHWAFASIGSSIAGTYLIYKLKIVERRYGSSKYAALVFISMVASTLIQTGMLVTGFEWTNSLSSGPYAVIFTILYQYQKIVPAIQEVPVLGMTITDKSYAHIVATYLLLSRQSSSVVPCLCGLVVGYMYDHTEGLKQWRFPKWVRSVGTRFFLPLLTSHDNTSKKATAPIIESTRQPTPQVVINEQDIDTIFSMFPNYSRQDIKNALVQAKSDLNRAAEILLTSEPSASSSSSH